MYSCKFLSVCKFCLYALQVNEKVPTVSIDKTDGCQVFFPSGIGSTEIVTAKSSEMNIMIPKDGGQDMVSTNVTPHCQ